MSTHSEAMEHPVGATTLTFTKVWICLLVLTVASKCFWPTSSCPP